MKVLIVDQMCGLSPYYLEQARPRFKDLLQEVTDNPKCFGGFRDALIIEINDQEKFTTPFGTTAFVETPDGGTAVWQYRWDSSG